MIERLVGRCVHKSLTGAVIDVNGVGYGADMTENSLLKLTVSTSVADAPVTVWVYTHVREDALKLFAFLTLEERIMFNLLISVDGVGPKLGLAILNRLDLPEIIRAAEQDDAAVLEDVPGIGGRLSKKIILELKPKVTKLLATGFGAQIHNAPLFAEKGAMGAGPTRAAGLEKAVLKDLQSALENFGYKEKELLPLLKRFEKAPPARDLAELMRLALQELTGAKQAQAGASGGDAAKKPPLEEVF